MHPPRCCQLGATPQRRVTMRSSRSPLRPTRDRIAGLVTCATTRVSLQRAPRRPFVRITTLENLLAPFTMPLKVFPPRPAYGPPIRYRFFKSPTQSICAASPVRLLFEVSSIELWADTYRTYPPFQDIEIATFDNLKRWRGQEARYQSRHCNNRWAC